MKHDLGNMKKADEYDAGIVKVLLDLALSAGIPMGGCSIRRSSSRFCLGVEHGDYNGTELFGVGTDRFIWMPFKPNDLGRLRLFSGNFEQDGLIDVALDAIPEPGSAPDSWSRFPLGVAWILKQKGYNLQTGMDAVLYGNILGGDMSRSASLTLNLLISLAEVNGIEFPSGMGTHYNPADRSIRHVPTDKIRHPECAEMVDLCREPFGIRLLGDVRSEDLFRSILAKFGASHPHLCKRLDYI